MNRPLDAPPPPRVIAPTVPVLVLVVLLLAYGSRLPLGPALLLAALGIAFGVALRAARYPLLRDGAMVPVLVVLGVFAAETPIAPIPELFVGVAGVVFVAWLMDDPSRPPAAVARGAVEWAIPAVGVGVAWTSAFLLPSTAAPVGVAGVLLVSALLLLAYLVRRPDLFERDEAPTL